MSSNDDLAAVSVGGGGNRTRKDNPIRFQGRVDNGVEDLQVLKDKVIIKVTMMSDVFAAKGDQFARGSRVDVVIEDPKKIEQLNKYLISEKEIGKTFEKGAILSLEDAVVDGSGIKAKFAEFFSAPAFEVVAKNGNKVMDRVQMYDKLLRVGKAGDKRQKVTVYEEDAAIALSGPEGIKSDLAKHLETLVGHAKAYVEARPEAKDFVDVWMGLVQDFDELSGLDQMEAVVDGWRFDPAIQDVVPNSQYAVMIRAIDSKAEPDAPNAILAAELYQGSMAYDDPNGGTTKLYRQMTFGEMIENALNYQLADKLKREPSPEERINYGDMLGGKVLDAVEKLASTVQKGDQQVVTYGSKNLDQLIKFLMYLDKTSLAEEKTRVWEVTPTLQLGIMGDSLKSPLNVSNTPAWQPKKAPIERNGQTVQYSDSIIMRGSLEVIAFSSKRHGTDDKYMVSKAVAQDAYTNRANPDQGAPKGPTYMIDEVPTKTTANLNFDMEKIGRNRTQTNYNKFNWDKDNSKAAENQQEGSEDKAPNPPAPGQ